MMCAWKEFIAILPVWMRQEIDFYCEKNLCELRIRISTPPELVFIRESIWLTRNVSEEDLSYCFNLASNYSPWTAATCSEGYITLKGGHRIGICGEVIQKNGVITGFRKIHSLCIRIARDCTNIYTGNERIQGSFIILGAPGWGKTTLLRDCLRRISDRHNVSVIDERCELFPLGFTRGKRMDVLTGCSKQVGIDIVLKSMRPEYIAVDEITAVEDCTALIHAVGCGTMLAATAHASSINDFIRRPIYRELWEYHLFDTIIQLHRDKTFSVERIQSCHIE